MERIFRPQKSIVTTIITTTFLLALFLFGIVIYSGNDFQNLIQAAFIIFGFAILFAVAVASSKIVITEDTITVTAMLFVRHKCRISEITSMSYLQNYAGFGEAIVVHYLGKHSLRELRMGIGAYGTDQIAKALNILREHNPAIKIDQQSKNIMNI